MAKKYTSDELLEIKAKFEDLLEDRGKKYLTLDKQLASRKIILNAFKKAGLDDGSVLESQDAFSALKQLEGAEGAYVIFTEVKLADTDVVKFLQRLRKQRPDKKDTVVLVTSDPRNPLAAQALKDGASGLIEKPLDVDKFLQKVREMKLL